MQYLRNSHLLKGFTLIELLVVIAIIGILSSVVLSSLTTARVRANDARRLTDMREIQKAVELYYSEYNHYPNSNGAWTSFDSPGYSSNSIVSPNAANLTAALSSYIGNTKDPKNLGGDSGYLYTGGGENYCILIYRTPENMNNFSSSMINMSRCGTISNGQCSGNNNIFYGVGSYASGC